MNIGTSGLGVMCGLLVASGASGARVVGCPPSVWQSGVPRLIAHASGDRLGPPNTIVAMERSRAAGADVLDLDLRMTSDGVIVAIHDRDVSSSTDGQGNVDELTWRQVQELDASARWDGEAISRPVHIPSLEQFLEHFPDGPISLELKQSVPSMAEELCDVLQRTSSLARVFVGSNQDGPLYAAREACPGLLITTTSADRATMGSSDEGDRGWCAASPIDQVKYRDGQFDASRVAASHRRGLAMFVWTVDDPEVLRQLAAIGVDAIYTNRSDIARTVFDEFDI